MKVERRLYATWFLDTRQFAPLIIYIDEAGFNVWTQRTRCRALVGQRAVRTVNGQRRENITIILAVSPQHGVEKHQFNADGTTVSRFCDFFRELEERVRLEAPCIFVMDNAVCHRSVRTISDVHTMRYLPPYSPFLTPVENAFSAWKSS